MSFPFDLHSAAVSDSHLPCHATTVSFFSRPQYSTAVSRRPCCGLEKNGMVGAWHGMASVNQTRLHCVNQMGKTNSKPLAARHAMCESAFIVQCTELNIRFLLAIFEGGKKSARMGFLRLAGTRHIQQTHCFFQVDVLYVSFLKTCVWIRECT